MRQYKRRKFFIKKDFQGKLILGYFLFVTGGCLFFIILLGLFSADTLSISYHNYNLQLGQTPIVLLKKILAAHWFFIVFGTVVLVLLAMLITHRIAGPMFRFEKTLDKMLDRNLDDPIYLRTKDEGKELANKINDFNVDLSQTLKNLQRHSDAMSTLLRQARIKSKDYPTRQKEDINSLFWSMEEKNRRIQAICSSYTLKDE